MNHQTVPRSQDLVVLKNRNKLVGTSKLPNEVVDDYHGFSSILHNNHSMLSATALDSF
jgi:hypothetical protein